VADTLHWAIPCAAISSSDMRFGAFWRCGDESEDLQVSLSIYEQFFLSALRGLHGHGRLPHLIIIRSLAITALLLSNARFPSFRCRSSVAISPFPFPYTVAVAAAYLSAVYGCNGTDFSYVIFTEQRNFTTAERQRNGGNRA